MNARMFREQFDKFDCRGLCGSAAVVTAAWVCAIAWAAAATPPSECGNCRRDLAAQHDLIWEAPCFLVGAIAAWILAGRTGGAEVRVARCAALVALAMWLVSVGFVHRWW